MHSNLAYGSINATETHEADCVNHLVAAINKETQTIDAIFNDKTWTVQIFTEGYSLRLIGPAYRIVKFNKANDARCMFDHLATNN